MRSSVQSIQRLKKTKKMPDDLCYATVRKTRKGGRVVEVCKTLVFGVLSLLVMLLSFSTASFTINTSFVERHNATDRGQNARKARKTLRFSKNWEVHNAMTFFVAYSYNFCWPVRTLRVRNEHGRWEARYVCGAGTACLDDQRVGFVSCETS